MKSRQEFDSDYYERFYFNPKTKVYDDEDQIRLTEFIFAYLKHLKIPVKRALDLGCGLGHWKKEIAKAFPKATYQGVEFSEFLCEKLGWDQGSVVDYQGKGEYDLIICQSVFQYLTDAQVAKGMKNLVRLCRGAVYLEIITAKDWKEHCDQRVTDGKVYLRSADFYQKHLQKYFRSIGGGLFLPKDSTTVVYELEGC